MNHLLVRAILALLLCLPMQEAYSQSTWEKMKQKAKSAWNSDTRKELWRKTQETVSTITESDMVKAYEYTVPITQRSFYNLVPDKKPANIVKILDMFEIYLGSAEEFEKIFAELLESRGFLIPPNW